MVPMHFALIMLSSLATLYVAVPRVTVILQKFVMEMLALALMMTFALLITSAVLQLALVMLLKYVMALMLHAQ